MSGAKMKPTLKPMLRSLTQRRMPLQFAAATEGLWHDLVSVGARKEFHLPPGGPFTG